MSTSETAPGAGGSAEQPTKRVAVVVVHGVADQKPGETAQTVVDLLTSASPPGVEYTASMHRDFAIRVDPMGPVPADAFDGEVTDRRMLLAMGAGDGTPSSRDRHWFKSLRLSFKSDFQRAHDPDGGRVNLAWAVRRAKAWFAPGRGRVAAAAVAAQRPPDSRDAKCDRGLQYTAYLLAKAQRNGSPTEDFSTRSIRMDRWEAGRTTRLDVYEMYWADLSRLSSALPRIISELFTIIFRLSRLGRDTVAEASRYASGNREKRGRRWVALAFFQALLDWCFTNILAQLFAQLLLVGALTMLIGLAAPDLSPDAAHRSELHPYLRAIGLVFIALPAAVILYFLRAGARPLPIALGLIAAMAGAGMFVGPNSPWSFVLLLTAIVTVAYHHALRAADERFPFVLQSGSVLWVGIVAWMVGHTIRFVPPDRDPWTQALHGALTGFELLLFLIKWWWICAAAVIVVWATLSISTERQPYDRRASAGTGRLGTLVAMAVFVAVSMALWGVLEGAVEKAVGTMHYDPVIWTTQPALSPEETEARKGDPGFCDADYRSPDVPHPYAGSFLNCRFQASTEMFSSVAVLLAAILGYLTLTVLPSVLAELSLTRSERPGGEQRLGLWLTGWYRRLDLFVLLVTVVGVVAVIGFAFYVLTGNEGNPIVASITSKSGKALEYLVFPATTAFAVLSAFGRFLSRTLPGVRAPLDAALDVDNYFREFPRRQIPRARIFSRYRALMRHIRDEGYDRVVIVSHSQGTVISAEFLRFVTSGSTDNLRYDRRPRMRELMGCDVRLLTLGCPLRQLYATRFPTYYQWVLDQSGEVNGPLASDIGVEVWANAFGSGDYVGRWLWSRALTPPDGFHPMIDHVVHDTNFKRRTIYQPWHPIPLAEGLLSRYNSYETSTGFGAHTHYFDLPASSQPKDRSIVAYLIDGLIANEYAPSAGAAPTNDAAGEG
jgi:hypothetical protein